MTPPATPVKGALGLFIVAGSPALVAAMGMAPAAPSPALELPLGGSCGGIPPMFIVASAMFYSL